MFRTFLVVMVLATGSSFLASVAAWLALNDGPAAIIPVLLFGVPMFMLAAPFVALVLIVPAALVFTITQRLVGRFVRQRRARSLAAIAAVPGCCLCFGALCAGLGGDMDNIGVGVAVTGLLGVLWAPGVIGWADRFHAR